MTLLNMTIDNTRRPFENYKEIPMKYSWIVWIPPDLYDP